MSHEMPKPGKEQQQIAKLAGRWIGGEDISETPFGPACKTTAVVDNKLSLDGFCVVQDYEQKRDGVVSFKGHGVFAWDPVKQKSVMHWFDTMGGVPQVFDGEWKGDTLTMQCSHPMGHTRCSFTVKGNQYLFTMEMSQDGKQWMSFMKGAYKK